ncbi:hypothetical protein [Thermococcus sp. JCM 11816]|uniref:hypothetical protein n=1 Tax=Thermococcus sp. (strain JCM 11816 / KS-1) TaxID=1295125 RepID=UPI0006D0041E
MVASEYALDSLLNLAGPVLLLYHDPPDVQSFVYETSGVLPGAEQEARPQGGRGPSSTAPPLKR